MGNTKHIIGQRVRVLRTREQLTQEQLGQMVGLNRVQICTLELGEGNVTLGNLDKVLDGFGLTIENMFDDGAAAGPKGAVQPPSDGASI